MPKPNPIVDGMKVCRDGHRYAVGTRQCPECRLRRNKTDKRYHRKPKDLIVPEGMKWCSACGEVLERSQFCSNKNTTDKLWSWCRSCSNRVNAARRQRHSQRNSGKEPDRAGTKRCGRCRVTKPKTEFSRDSCKADGLADHCRVCNSTQIQKYRTKWAGGTHERPQSKRCPHCNKTKLSRWFYPNSCRADGLSGWCVTCVVVSELSSRRANRARYRQYDRAYKSRIRQLPKLTPATKRCPECDCVKPSTKFHRNLAARDGLFSWCKECHRNYWRAYARANTHASVAAYWEALSMRAAYDYDHDAAILEDAARATATPQPNPHPTQEPRQ